MISMEDVKEIAAEAVRIHRDFNFSVEDSVNAAIEIHYEIQDIKRLIVNILQKLYEWLKDIEGVNAIEVLQRYIKTT